MVGLLLLLSSFLSAPERSEPGCQCSLVLSILLTCSSSLFVEQRAADPPQVWSQPAVPPHRTRLNRFLLLLPVD